MNVLLSYMVLTAMTVLCGAGSLLKGVDGVLEEWPEIEVAHDFSNGPLNLVRRILQALMAA